MATTQCTNRGLRVLVVDDDHDTAYSAAKLLSLHGYAARRAHNSQEAISIATQRCRTLTAFNYPGRFGKCRA